MSITFNGGFCEMRWFNGRISFDFYYFRICESVIVNNGYTSFVALYESFKILLTFLTFNGGFCEMRWFNERISLKIHYLRICESVIVKNGYTSFCKLLKF